MPPSSPLRAVPPPPPTAEAPQPAPSPPAPKSLAPRPVDLPTQSALDHSIADSSVVVPDAPRGSAPVPTPAGMEKDAAVDAMVDGVATLSVSDVHKAEEEATSENVPFEKPLSPGKGFGSPGRHRVPTSKSEFRPAV